MQKCQIIHSLHLFGHGIYFIKNCPFYSFPKVSYFWFADLLKIGISWRGYLLELQKDYRYPVKIKSK